jgi:hypothetical protein
VSASSTITDDFSLSASVGSITEKFSFAAGGNYVLNEHFALHSSIIGNEDYSTATIGAELAYDMFVAFIDYGVDLSANYKNEKDAKLGAGVKVIF